MQPYNNPLTVVRGDYFSSAFRLRTLVWNQVLNDGKGDWEAGPYQVLTGWTGLFQVRTDADAPEVAATGFVTIPDQTQMPGAIVYGIEADQAALLNGATYVYDIQLTDADGKPHTFMGGVVTVVKDVSR